MLVIQDRLLTKIAKRNMKNIVPLVYDMKKAEPNFLNNETMYKGMTAAYTGGNIGIYSNQISKIWNSGKQIDEEHLKVIKWLCMENNFVIDYAKTLYKPVRPKEVDKVIKKYTKGKLPTFFRYAKDKQDYQIEPINDSVMNRIMEAIPGSRLKFNKAIEDFDYRKLMNVNYEFSINEENDIVKSYRFWNNHQYLFNTQDEKHVKQEDMYMYQQIREKILSETEQDINYVVNSLVFFLYGGKTISTKKTLWACFGDVLFENLKNNLLKDTRRICPICGRRFEISAPNQYCCSTECAKTNHRDKMREYKKMRISTNVEPLSVFNIKDFLKMNDS